MWKCCWKCVYKQTTKKIGDFVHSKFFIWLKIFLKIRYLFPFVFFSSFFWNSNTFVTFFIFFSLYINVYILYHSPFPRFVEFTYKVFHFSILMFLINSFFFFFSFHCFTRFYFPFKYSNIDQCTILIGFDLVFEFNLILFLCFARARKDFLFTYMWIPQMDLFSFFFAGSYLMICSSSSKRHLIVALNIYNLQLYERSAIKRKRKKNEWYK